MTKGLNVQFLDEVVDIQEIVCIRYEVDFQQLSQPQRLSVTLAYYGLDGQPSKPLHTVELTIQGLERGLFEHAVISFDCNHSSCVTADFYSILSSISVPRAPALAASLFKDARGQPKRLVGVAETEAIFGKHREVLKSLYSCLYQFLFNVTRNSALLSELPDQVFPAQDKQLNMHDPVLIAEELISEFNVWTTCLAPLRHYLLEAMHSEPTLMSRLLELQSNLRLKEQVSQKVFLSNCSVNQHISLVSPEGRTERRKKGAARIRNSWTDEASYGVRVHGLLNSSLLYFEETSIESRSFKGNSIERLSASRQSHLVILVHGYQGTSADMRCVKAGMLGAFPHLSILVAESLGEITDFDILEQGRQLACEVQDYLIAQESMPDRVSFIGHSMGGLVVRAALPFLSEYKAKMHVLCTLNTPHIGFFVKPSALVGTGLWLFKVMKQTVSIDQLIMKDHLSPAKTALFCLSEGRGPEWFENVILVGSHQDSYTPVESALVEVPERLAASHPVFVTIAKNLVSRMKSLSRIDVNYKIERRYVDKLLGRAAHVECLDNEVVVRMLALKFYSLW
jgi:hypothetical protein